VPEEQIPMEDLDAKESLYYHEYPVNILETYERVTGNKKIKMCKVQFYFVDRNHSKFKFNLNSKELEYRAIPLQLKASGRLRRICRCRR
jgi:hypothetical protein